MPSRKRPTPPSAEPDVSATASETAVVEADANGGGGGDDAAPGQRSASAEEIAQDIATAIVEKRLPPGTRLREEALGKVYGVSRTKIRAALLTLSRDKLIQIVPDKGAVVSKPSVQEAREVFAVRRVLEAEVVRLFVAQARPRDFELLEQHIHIERATLEPRTSVGSAREKLLGDFHVVMAECTGNVTLTELVREMVARSSLIAMLYPSSNDPHCSSDEHEQLLRVCRQGDTAAAVACMSEHLQRVEASLRLDGGVPERQMDLVKALLS
jgi:DNA-binding GntR family transcriptional regulator